MSKHAHFIGPYVLVRSGIPDMNAVLIINNNGEGLQTTLQALEDFCGSWDTLPNPDNPGAAEWIVSEFWRKHF